MTNCTNVILYRKMYVKPIEVQDCVQFFYKSKEVKDSILTECNLVSFSVYVKLPNIIYDYV